jgi:hypothetical protein
MRKVLTLFLSLFVVLFLIAVPVFAQTSNKNVVLRSSETVDRDYFGGGETVTISGTVNGDAYVAGGTVLVDGTINGDLLAAGGTVTISGTVTGDIRIAGGNISLSGANIGGNVTAGGGQITVDSSTVIRGSIVAGGGNLQILAPIGRGATIGGGTVILGNTIGGDVIAGTGQLTLSNSAVIDGDLTYWSENKAAIADEATISGTVKQEMPPKRDGEEAAKGAAAAFAGFALFLKFADFAATFLVGLVLILLFPYFMKRSSEALRNKLGIAFVVGLVAVMVMPVLGIILLITILGIPLALLVFAVFAIELWLAKIFAMYAIGDAVLERTKTKTHGVLALIIGLVIYEVLTLVPVLGWLLQTVAIVSGFGVLLIMKREYYTMLHSKKQI